MMAALAKAYSQTTGSNLDADNLSAVLVFCGAGLLVSLAIAMACGLDLGEALL
jgi:hypothetical protein